MLNRVSCGNAEIIEKTVWLANNSMRHKDWTKSFYFLIISVSDLEMNQEAPLAVGEREK